VRGKGASVVSASEGALRYNCWVTGSAGCDPRPQLGHRGPQIVELDPLPGPPGGLIEGVTRVAPPAAPSLRVDLAPRARRLVAFSSSHRILLRRFHVDTHMGVVSTKRTRICRGLPHFWRKYWCVFASKTSEWSRLQDLNLHGIGWAHYFSPSPRLGDPGYVCHGGRPRFVKPAGDSSTRGPGNAGFSRRSEDLRPKSCVTGPCNCSGGRGQVRDRSRRSALGARPSSPRRRRTPAALAPTRQETYHAQTLRKHRVKWYDHSAFAAPSPRSPGWRFGKLLILKHLRARGLITRIMLTTGGGLGQICRSVEGRQVYLFGLGPGEWATGA
jgi:hypothetical protein